MNVSKVYFKYLCFNIIVLNVLGDINEIFL